MEKRPGQILRAREWNTIVREIERVFRARLPEGFVGVDGIMAREPTRERYPYCLDMLVTYSSGRIGETRTTGESSADSDIWPYCPVAWKFAGGGASATWREDWQAGRPIATCSRVGHPAAVNIGIARGFADVGHVVQVQIAGACPVAVDLGEMGEFAALQYHRFGGQPGRRYAVPQHGGPLVGDANTLPHVVEGVGFVLVRIAGRRLDSVVLHGWSHEFGDQAQYAAEVVEFGTGWKVRSPILGYVEVAQEGWPW